MPVRVLVLGVVILCCSALRTDAGEPESTGVGGRTMLGGEPVPATVTLHRLGGTDMVRQTGGEREESVVGEARTAADGRFLFHDIPAGTYVLQARRGEAYIGDQPLLVLPGSRHRVDLELEPARTLSGVVMYQDGTPVPGTATLVVRRSRSHTSSGPYNPWWGATPSFPSGPSVSQPLRAGAFHYVAPQSSVAIRFDLPSGVSWTWSTREPEASYRKEWTVPRPLALLKGVVEDDRGQPIQGAEVRLHHSPGGLPGRIVSLARSARDGRFRLATFAAGSKVTVTAPGYVGLDKHAYIDGPLTLKRVPTTAVEGTVVMDGKPVPGAVVHAALVRQRSFKSWLLGLPPLYSATSDAKGRYRIDGLPARPAVVFVRGGGVASADLASVRRRGRNPFVVEPRLGRTLERVLEVVPAHRFRGRVLAPDGTPIRGATILALGTTSGHSGRPGFSSAWARYAHVGPFEVASGVDGTFALENLVPGHTPFLADRRGWTAPSRGSGRSKSGSRGCRSAIRQAALLDRARARRRDRCAHCRRTASICATARARRAPTHSAWRDSDPSKGQPQS